MTVRTALLLFATALGLAGCDLRDMYVQPKAVPYRGSAVFADGRSARHEPEGTVARGDTGNDALARAVDANGAERARFPFAPTAADVRRGRERFDIACAPCHGYRGDGLGRVVQRGYARPPSFHEPRLRAAPPGHFVRVMTDGWGAMPSYRDLVAPADRWRITAYVRALQRSQNASWSDVPDETRAALETASDSEKEER